MWKQTTHLYSEMYSGPCQTDKMDIFPKIVNGLQPPNIFAKSSMLDAWRGSGYVFLFSVLQT